MSENNTSPISEKTESEPVKDINLPYDEIPEGDAPILSVKNGDYVVPDYSKLDLTIGEAKEVQVKPDYARLDLTIKKMKYTNEKEEAKKFFLQALKFKKHNRPHEALEMFQKTIEFDPEHAEAYRMLANLYKDTGDEDTAAEYYKQFLQFAPQNNEALSFLFNLYLDRKNPVEAADVLKIKIETVKKPDIKKQLLKQTAELYFIGKAYDKALETYRIILQDEVFNPEIFNRLMAIYKYLGDSHKWKACQQVLLLNNRLTRDKITEPLHAIQAPGPLTAEIFEQLIHPGETAFKKYFGWMKPMFRLMESETPPEILRLSETVPEDTPDYNLYKDCCHYLSMEIPPLRHYSGSADFAFIADPLGKDSCYSLIYNDKFLNNLSPPEKAFLFINQLTIIKSGFAPLLNLSVADMTKVFIEIAASMLSFVNILQNIPIDKAAEMVKKTSKTTKIFEVIGNIQTKLKSFKLLGKSTDEMEVLMKKSMEMIPGKKFEDEGFSYKNIMNARFLESALQGFFHTADRVSYYMTRDLTVSTRSLLYMLSGTDALDRVEKFGLQPYVEETKNGNLKRRLGDLFCFAIDSDLLNMDKPEEVDAFRKLEG